MYAIDPTSLRSAQHAARARHASDVGSATPGI